MYRAKINGRVAIVTGAAGGFGRQFCRALLGAGAKVAALDRGEAGLAQLSGELDNLGGGERLITRALDIARFAECRDAVQDVNDALGPVDILINNAALGMGVIRDDHETNLVSLDEIEPEIWDAMIAVNMSGPWNMTKLVMPGMVERKWGRVINVTTSFFTMLRGRFHPYGPSKAGLEALSAGHAKEFAGTGVTVNIVVPGGPADTQMVPEASGFKREDLVKPETMTWPALWLCSDEAGDVTGSRFVAALWDHTVPPNEARAASEAPLAWPDLAQTPVWPGGAPADG